MNKTFEKLEKLLKKDERFVSKDGKVMRNAVYEAANKLDEKLISLLLSDENITNLFFKKVNKVLVFDKQKFNFMINNREMLPDSYTRYRQDIGLINSRDEFISATNDVVLSFPFKDCVLEFDSTDPNEKREEIFFNEVLAYDEIDHLFSDKVLTNATLIDKKGEKEITKFDDNSNLLIKGNNLLAMHTLLPRYKGQIKLMYWDILYNTESDNVPFADTFKHSSWLTMMKNRLDVAKELLRDDGVICLQCDDNEMAYLKVLCDEIFGRENFLNCIVNQSANSVFGTKAAHKEKAIIKIKDYIVIYKMENFKGLNPLYVQSEKMIYDSHEFVFENNKKISTVKWFNNNYKELFLKLNLSVNKSNISKLMKLDYNFRKEAINKLLDIQFSSSPYTINDLTEKEKKQLQKGNIINHNGIKLIQENDGKGLIRFCRSLRESCKLINGEFVKCDILGDIWNNSQGYGNINNEGVNIRLQNGKKPEILLEKILTMFTEETDLVLDCYFGTGTTGAVAMKMGRRFIGIEQLDSHIDLAKMRLKNVIAGDETGISKTVGWIGGGQFIYCELKKLNEELIDEIKITKNKKGLLKTFNKIIRTGFINHYIDIEKLKNLIESSDDKKINDIKKLLIEILDKNQLYVNLDDMDDEDFKILANDKQFTKSFYDV